MSISAVLLYNKCESNEPSQSFRVPENSLLFIEETFGHSSRLFRTPTDVMSI
uniref:Uncharacterized protein n=1 Tax=Anguilla anguilla TaxID=7936 RepID=A0A0E9S5E9_ANGAN